MRWFAKKQIFISCTMCPERSKTLQNFDSHFAPLCAAVLQIMGRNQKYDAIIIASLYFWPESAFRHSFFKGDDTFHPLNCVMSANASIN